MRIELQISEEKEAFFLEYLESLKEGIVEKIEIKESRFDFFVDSKEEVKNRIMFAEENANYTDHDLFWKNFLRINPQLLHLS